MGSVAGDDQEISPGLLEGAGGIQKGRERIGPFPQDSGGAVGDLRVIVDQDAEVILITVCWSTGQYAPEEFHRSLWPHTP